MSHTFSSVVLHVIFSAKDRRPLIAESFRLPLYDYMGGLIRKQLGKSLAIGGTDNHVHALLSIGTDASIGETMAKLKSVSSGWVHKNFSHAEGFAWQKGYGVFSVSLSKVAQVQAYIARQEEHHKAVPFEDEFMGFLKRHGVPFDPTAVWE